MSTPARTAPATQARLRNHAAAPRRPQWRGLLGLALLPAAAALAAWLVPPSLASRSSYVTEPARRGNLVLTVSAHGSLQPTRSVGIGSELSGTVARVLVDVNQQVRRGQLLAELDAAKLRGQLRRSRAALGIAAAAVGQSVATREEAQGMLARLAEVRRLSGGKVPSSAEFDSAIAALARARAVEAGARAGVSAARAALATDAANLARAAVRAPMDGVILHRDVDAGAAVAASQAGAPLFVLAEDLRHLRLQLNVGQADVGAVRDGQEAHFTVGAYPGREFPATVIRIGYGATIVDNMVTYPAVLEVDNANLGLRPGMSASARIRTAEHQDVLLVPNGALRFTPASQKEGRAKPGMPDKAAAPAPGRGAQRVWVLREGAPVGVDINTGRSNGQVTEVLSGALQAGMQVIVDQRLAP